MKPSVYWLFVFLPVTVILEHAGKVSPPVIFFSAALAIVPIAGLDRGIHGTTRHAHR
jgi:hypothetical protein